MLGGGRLTSHSKGSVPIESILLGICFVALTARCINLGKN